MAPPPPPSSSILGNFETFYYNWLTHHQLFLQQLLLLHTPPPHDLENHENLRLLITQVLSHYQLFHDQKTQAAGEDFFYFLTSPWLSSYERSLLWLTGVKPSTVLRLLDGAVRDLSPTQELRVEELKGEVRRKEREITEAMASLQETVAAPPMLGIARREGQLLDGEISEMDGVIEDLRKAMVGVVERADMLRGSIMKMLMEILSLNQMVNLLAAAADFQLTIRRWGLQRDNNQT